MKQRDPLVRGALRFGLLWVAATVVVASVALAASEGEPVCDGPLILDVDTSAPPQCPDPIDGLVSSTGPLMVAGLVVAVLLGGLIVLVRRVALVRIAHSDGPVS